MKNIAITILKLIPIHFLLNCTSNQPNPQGVHLLKLGLSSAFHGHPWSLIGLLIVFQSIDSEVVSPNSQREYLVFFIT